MALPARKLAVQFTAIGAKVRKRVVDTSVLKGIDDATGAHAREIVAELQQEPPVPPNSTYTRTHELRDSWRARRGREGQNIVWYITNDASDQRGRFYATFVQGQYQTSDHASTGWKNINDYTNRSGLQATIQGLITQAAAGFSLGR